jgi:uncharacterized protein (DUF2141 family)
MKWNVCLVLVFAALPFTTLGQTSVEVTLTGIRPGKGSLRVGLFTEANFLKNPVEGKIVKASGESIVVKFENVRDGEYALSVIHDANENGELDKTKLGIPREGFAFSNNAMGKKGPPSFEKAKFEVKAAPSIKQALVMRYP